MWMARDIKSSIITQMNSSTYGISAYITAINSTRGDTTALPMQLGVDADSGQYPQVYVDLGDSSIPPVKGMSYDDLIEDFQLEVTAILKDSQVTKLKNDTENYIQAILQCLEGYSSQTGIGSYICEANSILRADIDTVQDQTVRAATVVFTVYSNQL